MAGRPGRDVHCGRDGWLFLVAGSNNAIAQYHDSFYIAHQIELWRELVLARATRMADLGIAYRHVVVPEKLSIYGDLLDGLAIDERLSPAYRLVRGAVRRPRPWHRLRLRDWPRLRRTCVDLVGPLRTARRSGELYYRTDSHWSFPGCHLGYLEICRSVGARPRAALATLPSERREYLGDLGARLDPPRTETAALYDRQVTAVRRYANPIVLLREADGLADTLHTGSHVIFRNPEASDPRRVVLFGDSCAHFDHSMLTILIAETFREVHFIWSSAIDWSYVERARPDIVLTEIAERFMAQLPDDTFDVQAYAEDRYRSELRQYRSKPAEPRG